MSILMLSGRRADLGHGLIVQRLLPHRERRMVGPFVFYDHAGPVVLPEDTGRKADVRPHPHIGLATVSYLLSGRITHRDSLGFEQDIVPGDVNWMTAGRGISHSERFESSEAFHAPGLELLQSWLALPEADEEIAPAFDHYAAQQLPQAHDDGRWLRVIAGSAYGLTSPVKTRSPLFYIHMDLDDGARFTLPEGYLERAFYVVRGEVECDGQRIGTGHLVVVPENAAPRLRAIGQAVVMLLGGEPLGNRYLWWNFVSSSRERIEQAKADWLAGRIMLPPNDNTEFIPLPDK